MAHSIMKYEMKYSDKFYIAQVNSINIPSMRISFISSHHSLKHIGFLYKAKNQDIHSH